MRHLNEVDLVDAADGRPDAAAASHLAGCTVCEARLLELRNAMQVVLEAEGDVPEPVPSFWSHFPTHVARAIDAPVQARGTFSAGRWLWGGAAVAAACVLMLLLLPSQQDRGASPQETRPQDAAALVVGDGVAEDFESDEAWALVRAVAEELDYEDVREAGLAPRAGSVERAALELSADERAELARLIEQELKRTGASIP